MLFSKNDIKEMLGESSRKVADMVTETMLENQESYPNLVELTFDDSSQVSMRAARVMELCEEQFPELFTEFREPALEILPKVKTEGVKRAILKIFTRNPFFSDDELQTSLIELCFKWLNSSDVSIATKAYAIMILEKISIKYQEFIPELYYTLDKMTLIETSVGVLTVTKRSLKKLKKYML